MYWNISIYREYSGWCDFIYCTNVKTNSCDIFDKHADYDMDFEFRVIGRRVGSNRTLYFTDVVVYNRWKNCEFAAVRDKILVGSLRWHLTIFFDGFVATYKCGIQFIFNRFHCNESLTVFGHCYWGYRYECYFEFRSDAHHPVLWIGKEHNQEKGSYISKDRGQFFQRTPVFTGVKISSKW